MYHIEVIARGVCIRDNKVLLCRHVKHGYNYLPGGHIEFGESASNALAREMVEEAAVPVTVGPCVFMSEGTFESKKRPHHELNVVFLMELPPDAEVVSVEPDIAFDWVDLASVVNIDLRPDSAKAWLASSKDVHTVQWISEIKPIQ